MKNLFVTLLLFFSFVSCQEDETLTMLSGKGIEVDTIQEIASRNSNSEIEQLYQLQTDKIAMLINAIQLENDVYVLKLSAEDAASLGIPDSTYSLVQSILVDYNATR